MILQPQVIYGCSRAVLLPLKALCASRFLYIAKRSVVMQAAATMTAPSRDTVAVAPSMPAASSMQRRAIPHAKELRGRPRFHLQPLTKGWINDPNGVHFDPRTGLYHMFYQHFPEGSVWRWGLSWGHACSKDLMSWHHLPPILSPTPDSPDADGVWSGCAFPTDEGTVILNTACRLRTTTPAEKMPPAELDLGLQMIESQAFAVADLSDPLLRSWTKGTEPLLAHPPVGGLTGWRDPFLVGRPGDGVHDKYTMLVGAGHSAERAGTALVYTSDRPISGWTYERELCRGDGTTGTMWECPLLAKVPLHPSPLSAALRGGAGDHSSKQHVLVICPENAHHAPVYYLGDYNAPTLSFDLERATKPQHLDMGGATFYAPNMLMNDPHGRLVMWGWCQELGRPNGDYDSACCLSMPRLLWRNPQQPERLWQEPLPLMSDLRHEEAQWSKGDLHLTPGRPYPLPQPLAAAVHLELQVTLQPPTSLPSAGRAAKTGLLLRPPAAGSQAPLGEASGRNGAAVLYDWTTGRLDVVYSDGTVPLDVLAGLPAKRLAALNKASTVTEAGSPASSSSPQTHRHLSVDGQCESDEDDENDVERRALNISGCHAVGGVLHHAADTAAPLQPVTLRVFLDHSLMEVFTSTGQVLTTRVYRDHLLNTPEEAHPVPVAAAAGAALPTIELATFGAASTVSHADVYELGSIWESCEALSELQAKLTTPAHEAATAAATATTTVLAAEEDAVCDLAHPATCADEPPSLEVANNTMLGMMAAAMLVPTSPQPRISSCGLEAAIDDDMHHEPMVATA